MYWRDLTLADLEMQKAFAEKLFAQTRDRNKEKANATIRRHETKYKLRVYVPGEIVLVDVGKKTKVKQKRDMVKATVVEALTNNYYTVEFAAGPKIGDQEDVNGDLVEPLQKKSQVMSDQVPERKEQKKKAHKGKIAANRVIAASPKPKSVAHLPNPENKRSASHWFKQTDKILTMERGNRGARAKIFSKHQG